VEEDKRETFTLRDKKSMNNDRLDEMEQTSFCCFGLFSSKPKGAKNKVETRLPSDKT
jgi:hypothetical protein